MSQVVTIDSVVAKTPVEQPNCDLCLRSSDCLLGQLTREALNCGVGSSLKRIIHHAGDYLFEQGSSAKSAYFVSSGFVKTEVSDSNGDVQVAGFPGAGDLLGLTPVNKGRHALSAQALDTVAVCRIDQEELNQRVTGSVDGVRLLLDQVGRQDAQQAAHLLRLGQKTALQRMAGFLLSQAKRLERAGLRNDVVNLPMSRADLGSYLALAVETVSRLLTGLQKKGLVRVYRRHVEITDSHGLERLTQAADDLEQRGVA